MQKSLIVLDFLAMSCSLTAAWTASSAKRSTWGWSFIACFLNFLLYKQVGVYGHAMLDLWYLSISIYGWSAWKNRAIKRLSLLHCSYLIILILIGSYLLQFFLTKIGSRAPNWDSLSITTALAAQLCMALKLIDNWWLWIAHDIMNFMMATEVNLSFQRIKQLIYLFIGIRGYYEWNRLSKKERVTDDHF
jgi:nicotinamide mononucleotide transporter